MANKTGLLCSVDDLPPEASHPNAQVKSLVAGSNIPRKALDRLLTHLGQAKHLHFNDSYVEHQLFSHLFPLTQGGFVQGHKGMNLGKYNHLSLLHVDRRGAHDKFFHFSCLTGP